MKGRDTMRKLLSFAVLTGVLTLGVGCNKPTPTGSGTGPSLTTTKPVTLPSSTGAATVPVPTKEGKVSLGELPKSIDIPKGKNGTVEITVKREDYAGPINVTFDAKDAKGITLPEKAVIKEGTDKVEVEIKVADDAKDAEVPVTIWPEDKKIKEATGTLKIKVTDK